MNIYLSLLKFHIGFYESCFTSLRIECAGFAAISEKLEYLEK